jgi:MFS family permease
VTTSTTTPPQLESGHAPRRWVVGTLVYTAAGLAAVVAWLLVGCFVWQLKERGLNPVAQLVLKQLRASDFIVGTLVYSLPALLGMVLGPIVCTWSDRHRGRWGRRIPYLLIPTPLAAASLVGLAFTPECGQFLHELLGPRSPGLERSRVTAFALFWTISELASLTAQYLFYGLINDVVPRSFIGRFFGLFRAAGLLAGIAFNFSVIGYSEFHARAVFLGLAVLYAIGFTAMCLRVREGQYPPPEPMPMNERRDGAFAPVVAYFKESFSNPFYVWLYAGTTLAALAFVPVNSFTVLFARSLGMSMETYGRYLALTYVISFALSYGLGWLADRFHPLKVGIVSIALYAVAMIYGGLFATTPKTFAAAFVLHGVVSGCFFTVQVPIFQRLLPAAKFGQLFSAANLLLQLGSVLLPLTMGRYLDVTGNVYRHTFLAGGVIALLGTVSLIEVQRRAKRLAV